MAGNAGIAILGLGILYLLSKKNGVRISPFYVGPGNGIAPSPFYVGPGNGLPTTGFNGIEDPEAPEAQEVPISRLSTVLDITGRIPLRVQAVWTPAERAGGIILGPPVREEIIDRVTRTIIPDEPEAPEAQEVPITIRKTAHRITRIEAIDVKIPTFVKERWTPAERAGGITLGPETPTIVRVVNGVELREV